MSPVLKLSQLTVSIRVNNNKYLNWNELKYIQFRLAIRYYYISWSIYEFYFKGTRVKFGAFVHGITLIYITRSIYVT